MNQSTDNPGQRRRELLRAAYDHGSLYLVTSEALSQGRTTVDVVGEALAGGIRMIQLRDKELSLRRRYELAVALREMTSAGSALLWIDDHADLALLSGADGVHCGQDDIPCSALRRAFPDLLIGVSTHHIDEAIRAEKDGADSINIGPIFATRTKEWNKPFLGLDAIREIRDHIGIPFSAMGGINEENLASVVRAGARIAAVVSEITKAADIREKVRRMQRMIADEIRNRQHSTRMDRSSIGAECVKAPLDI